MSGSALRAGLSIVGVLLVGGGVAAALGGHAFPACVIAAWGAILLLALLVERWRYKRVTEPPAEGGWTETGERFMDPESGKVVAVYFNPATGERRYVGDTTPASRPV